MEKYIVPIIIAIVAVVLILIVILISKSKKNKKKSNEPTYQYEGYKKDVINVSNINEIDNKYRTPAVNLSTDYAEQVFISQEPDDIEIETLEDNIVENITPIVEETKSTVVENPVVQVNTDSQIAFGNAFTPSSPVQQQNAVTICPQCGTNIQNATNYCPGCGKML